MFNIMGRKTRCIAPNVPGQYPGWRQDRALGREVDTVMGRALWSFRAEESRWAFELGFISQEERIVTKFCKF